MSQRKMNAEKVKQMMGDREDKNLPQNVQKLVDEMNTTQYGSFDRLLFDCCTVTIAPESIQDLPRGLINVGADFFALECCTSPVEVDANTPMGVIPDSCTVNEVKAIGHINYVASFSIPTYYNNGSSNCAALVDQTFSCSGTVCVNNTLCYTRLDAEDVCPDFCNWNTQAYAYIADVDYCNPTKAIVTIGLVFILPGCLNNICPTKNGSC